MTPGFARRSLVLASNSYTGPGVQVLGIHRHADPGLIANRRAADAELGAANVLAGFHAQFEGLVGGATNPASISMRVAEFESSLITAASHPESVQRLDAVAMRAKSLASTIAAASEGVRQARVQADRSIGIQVDRLNQALNTVQKLNTQITSVSSSGGEISALLDQRQQLVDEINEIAPVNVIARDHGQIALYSDGGAVLLDGTAVQIGFTATSDIMPHMTADNGLLSGLEINGNPVRTGSQYPALGGGSLAAQFQVRDELAVSAHADLDAVARDLIERFEAASLDPSLSVGDPGLFTDSGAAFDAAFETGLAGRLAINAGVDPTQGGNSWKLRAGLGATDPGVVGAAGLLLGFGQVLSASRSLGSGTFGTGQMTAADVSSSLLSSAAQNTFQSDRVLSFASASRTEMARIELEQGVDTDAELQALMLVEQAYAANARVIQTVDSMMETLLRL